MSEIYTRFEYKPQSTRCTATRVCRSPAPTSYGSKTAASWWQHDERIEHADPAHFAPVVTTAVHQLTGYHTLGQNPPLVVDVLEEQVDGVQPLGKTTFERFPLARGDKRGSRSKGKIRSVPCSSPYTVNVMPWARKARSASV
jgi:hypothetical protein